MAKPLTLSFDGWTLYRESGELEREGKRIRLQDLPFQILDELLSRPGEVVTREQLIARLWPKTVVDFDANLNSSVRRLRAALQDDADAPRYIETLPRKGYRYIGAVPRCEAPAEPSPEPGSLAPVVVTPERGARASRRSVSLVLVIASIVATITVATYLLRKEGGRPAIGAGSIVTAPATRLRLAVLPFDNLSPDPSNAFFTDGMHEEVLNTIATRAPHLEVLSRTTMMVYQAAPRAVRDIAKELGVTHILEGSVRRDGQRVRLVLQLIDASHDIHLWSKTFDRQLVDVLGLQSEIAKEVASQLAVKLSGKIGELPPSTNPQAYDAYLRARSLMQTVGAIRSARDQRAAEEFLSRAIALEDTFGAAYIERARVRMSRFTSSQDTSEANLRALEADLATARRLMGDSPPLLGSEAQYAALVDFDREKALTLLSTARRLHPNSSEVYLFLGRQLSSTGKPAEALGYFKRAAELDPANPVIFSDWAATLKMARLAEESLRVSGDFDARYPGRITYGLRLFGFTGELDRLEREVADLSDKRDAEAQLAARFELFLFSNRVAELGELIERSGVTTLPQVSYGGFAIPALGRKPVAELRGWVKLLERDAVAAARDGRVVLEFVAQQPATRWNAWYLRMLAAEGELFVGDKTKAGELARSALAMAPRNVHIGIQRYAPALAARILAWAGAEDEAVGLLEQLSTGFPMIGPAEVIRDPLYTTPLAANERFKTLEPRLSAELVANRKLSDRAHSASARF